VAGGATLDFDPGTYILDRGDLTVSGNSGTGVTLVLTSRTGSNYGAIDIRTGSTIEITAPALGASAGIPGSLFGLMEISRPPATPSTAEAARISTMRFICLAGTSNIPENHPPPLDAAS
jgi:hypothetical protein